MPEEKKTFEEELFGDAMKQLEKSAEDDGGSPAEEGDDPAQAEEEAVILAGGEEPEATPEAEPAAEPETPAEDADTEKFYQTSYQEAMAKLKQVSPILHDKIKTELKDERGQQQPAQTEDAVLDTSDSDDPYAVLAEVKKTMAALPDMMRQETASIQKEMRAQEQFVSEYGNANAVLEGFLESNKIPKESAQAAYNEAVEFGINPDTPGGPTQMAKFIIKELRHNALAAHLETKVTEATAGAETKAISALQVAQPTPGAMPEPPKLTKDEKVLKSMQDVGSSETSKEVFG